MAERLMDHILAPNATLYERTLASQVDRLLSLDTERLRRLWDPYRCHIDDLPYLAWSFSADISVAGAVVVAAPPIVVEVSLSTMEVDSLDPSLSLLLQAARTAAALSAPPMARKLRRFTPREPSGAPLISVSGSSWFFT